MREPPRSNSQMMIPDILEVGSAPVRGVLGFLFLLNIHLQHLTSEGESFRFLNELLVGRVGLCPHHHVPKLGVDLCIQLGIAYQIHYPPFSLVKNQNQI